MTAVLSAARPIASLDEVRVHLQYAIGIELTTIPAYLAALYSIEPGANTAAYDTIQSVVLEEMLHMALAANVLNAIGGVPSPRPVGDLPSPVPAYPTKVPFIDRIPVVHLRPFSVAAVDEFLAIEQPDSVGDAMVSGPSDNYGSIGDFYAAIELGLRTWCPPAVFDQARIDRRGCQARPDDYYGGAGRLVEVHDLDTALAALAEIVREGEGVPRDVLKQSAADHARAGAQTPGRAGSLRFSVDDLDRLPYGWKMYSHYARFKEIRAGAQFEPSQMVEETPAGDVLPTDWAAVRRMTVDPTAEAFRGTPAHAPMVACNVAYTRLVNALYAAFNGGARLADAVPAMYDLKYRANALLNTPSPLDPSLRLGPAFEYLGEIVP